MKALAVLLGLVVGFGILYCMFRAIDSINNKITKRKRDDYGGSFVLFITPHKVTELLRKWESQRKAGTISHWTYCRRRRKALMRFMDYATLKGDTNAIKTNTNEGVDHLRELDIMRKEQFITEDEYQNMYKEIVKRMSYV